MLSRLGGGSRLQEQELDSSSSKQGEVKAEDPKGKGTEAPESVPVTTLKVDSRLAEKQRKVRSTIVMSLTDQVLRKVIQEQTAAGMLRRLNALYTSKSLSNRIYLKQCLYGYKMNESISVESNIDEFLRIITDLGNGRVNISDEDQPSSF